jgi:alkanesulfonate monooxygenase SsuD/methylene tetrahydromethanopterin reductase-like flavin-dependent oxidoreductase (luciferase family)
VAEARDTLREHVASYVGRAEVYRDIVARGGYKAEAAAIHEAWKSGNTNGAIKSVPDALVDDIGVAGTPETADDALEPWEDTCIDTALFHFPPDSIDRGMVEATIDGLSPKS